MLVNLSDDPNVQVTINPLDFPACFWTMFVALSCPYGWNTWKMIEHVPIPQRTKKLMEFNCNMSQKTWKWLENTWKWLENDWKPLS